MTLIVIPFHCDNGRGGVDKGRRKNHRIGSGLTDPEIIADLRQRAFDIRQEIIFFHAG